MIKIKNISVYMNNQLMIFNFYKVDVVTCDKCWLTCSKYLNYKSKEIRLFEKLFHVSGTNFGSVCLFLEAMISESVYLL